MKHVLNRVIKAHGGNPDFLGGYIALRKDGEVGAACLKWSFNPYNFIRMVLTNFTMSKG